MTENIDFMPENLSHAAESLKSRMPFYGELLDFYTKVFSAQEQAKADITASPITIAPELLAAKREENLPLVSPGEFKIDLESSMALFNKLCDIAEAENPTLTEAVKKISAAKGNNEIDLSSLLSGCLENKDGLIENAAEKLGITDEQLGFFLLNSTKPSVVLSAKQLAEDYLDKDKPHKEGYCPVCGTKAALSILEGEGGKRSLYCDCCTHTWESGRIFCPYCNNREGKTLSYFYSETEKEFRVDVCDKCKKYIKTVDTRDLDRLIYPAMEQIATLHLDIKATESGYTGGGTLKP